MKAAVIYESIYGSTEKYARWISEALSCDLFKRKEVKESKLTEYDVIIYGGGLYAGGVAGIKLLIKNFDKLKDKKLILYTCGLSDPNNPDNILNIQKSLSKVLTPEMREKIKIFYLRGGMDYSKLSFAHRTMMAMLYKMIQKKPDEQKTQEDREMIETYGKVVDFCDKATIRPIIEYANEP